MNTTVIAKHLGIDESAIIRIERWKNVLFVVIKGLGARFVSYKIVADVIKKMVAIGGNRWQAHGKDRIYFDGRTIGRIMELSNSKIRQISSAKFYYDVTAGTWQQEYTVITHGVHDKTLGGSIRWVLAVEELLAVTVVE